MLDVHNLVILYSS